MDPHSVSTPSGFRVLRGRGLCFTELHFPVLLPPSGSRECTNTACYAGHTGSTGSVGAAGTHLSRPFPGFGARSEQSAMSTARLGSGCPPFGTSGHPFSLPPGSL